MKLGHPYRPVPKGPRAVPWWWRALGWATSPLVVLWTLLILTLVGGYGGVFYYAGCVGHRGWTHPAVCERMVPVWSRVLGPLPGRWRSR